MEHAGVALPDADKEHIKIAAKVAKETALAATNSAKRKGKKIKGGAKKSEKGAAINI